MPDYLNIMKDDSVRRKRRSMSATLGKRWQNVQQPMGGASFFTQNGQEGTVAGYPPQPYVYSGATSPPSY